ncbi:MAG: hypothetical protein NXI15_02470 [Gammaproteobacteria bacterium]|nr:hypothetical protein [Gammaproteobacteria bacterium]
MFIRIAIIFLGIAFLVPGLLGVLRPEQLAEGLGLTPDGSAGLMTVRALIGAPYLAMAAIAIYAALRGQWAWLVPLAAIEGAMMLVRIMTGITEGFDSASIRIIIVELVCTVVLALGAILPARSQN